MKTLDRYIAKEFLLFFFAVILGFVVLMTGNTVFIMSDMILNKKIPFFIVSQILLLRVPAMVVLGFPVATIFAIMLTMGRLSKDSELIAMRTNGISFQRIIVPLVLTATVISIASFYMNEIIVPNANHISQNYLRKFFMSEVMENAKANVFFKIPGDMVLYTKKYDEKSKDLRNVMMFETSESGFPSITDVSNGAISDENLVLQDGITFKINKDGLVNEVVSFGNSVRDISREIRQIFGTPKTAPEMTSGELRDVIDRYKDQNLNAAVLETDYYFKFSIPVANLAFVLIGLLFVVSSPRHESYTGIIIALILVTAYWVMMTVMRSMGHKGMLEPWLAAWGQNILYFIVAVPLLIKARQ